MTSNIDFIPEFIKNEIKNAHTRIYVLVHCAGMRNQIEFEQKSSYRQQNDFKKLNKNVQLLYNSVASRFDDKCVTGDLIRRLLLCFLNEKQIFKFWSSVHNQTLLLNNHSTQYIWLLPAKFTCTHCNSSTSLQKLRTTDVITEHGIFTGIEIQLTCKTSKQNGGQGCPLKGKTVRYNGWVDGDDISYFPPTMAGPNRMRLFSRALNRYDCKTKCVKR